VNEVLKVAIAQICREVGYYGVTSAALETLSDATAKCMLSRGGPLLTLQMSSILARELPPLLHLPVSVLYLML